MRASWRILLLACVMIGACAAPTPAQAPATTQPPGTPAPAGETAGPRAVTFQTEDGVTLSGTLFGQGGSGVVLSHMFPTDQTSWHAFANTLAGNGYLALAYDFRGYGKS